MLNYLVEAHCGGYYISSDDPYDIERICPTCGDCDRIVAEFDDEDADESAWAILDYFAEDSVMDEFDLLQSCRPVEELHAEIDEKFSPSGIASIVNAISLASDDPIAAAMFRLDPHTAYSKVLDKMLNECGVSFDGKPGDTEKQEDAVMEIARTFDPDCDAVSNLKRIACIRLDSKRRAAVEKAKLITSDDLDAISHAYSGSCLHDGLIAAIRHNL